MRLLLDTHVAIWWINGHKLPSEVKAMLVDNANSLHVSVVSAWEVSIKTSLGKLPEFKGGSKAFLAKLANIPITLLPIESRHLEKVETLPFHHRDPFDRLLAATAMVEDMTILTADENIRKYDVPSVW